MELPMFPLGTVLFPSLFLPLHVFEPRYRLLARHCVDGDREFGVVLIERGSEVGGDDVRTSVGTVARIIEATELDDGRWMLATVGARRLRVREWLVDDPYPRADVDDWDDESSFADMAPAYEGALAQLRRVLALKAELGDPSAEATIELSDDPVLGSYQACAVAPLGPADQQKLLLAAGPEERLQRLCQLLSEEEQYLRARLSME
ncbi:MAG TPA: LON peptidase substrate-binding domain-containing protein [Acidimicrobiales bacterium]